MGVINTERWLCYYLKYWHEKKDKKQKLDWQRQILIQPLEKRFSMKVEEIHSYFMDLGLPKPDLQVDYLVTQFIENKILESTETYYQRLLKEWNGPDVPIYIFPLISPNQKKHVDENKMGVSFSDFICLFIEPLIDERGIQSLMTHEYHHVCRLALTNETEEKITLLESIVMEGLAEAAVKEEVGTEHVANWMTRYNEEFCRGWFERLIQPNLLMQGRKSYHELLFGDRTKQIPEMIGYAVGYYLIQSVVKKEKIKTKELLKLSSNTLYELSGW
ncbi:hypothetical protein BTS2_3789 [Bacillus sp. TS-2]|nr:hypothetical protein BTS2_3789 [Bacillus sp. TS-2]